MFTGVEDFVDEAVGKSVGTGEYGLAVDVGADPAAVSAGVCGQQNFHRDAYPQDLSGLDTQVTGLPIARVDGRLVDDDTRVGQHQSFPGSAGGHQDRRGRAGLSQAHSFDVGGDELDRVVDGHHGGYPAARRVDVERDVLVEVVGLQAEQLGDDIVGRGVVDGSAEEDDPLAEQLGVRV